MALSSSLILILLSLLCVVVSSSIPKKYFEEHPIPKVYHQNTKTLKTCNDTRFKLNPELPHPDFFLIGGAKCGTTSFHEYIQVHPNIKLVGQKEPNFFSYLYLPPAMYQTSFVTIGDKRGKLMSGEFSTSYLLHPLVPKRIYTEVPNAKLIIMIRNPIDRAYSHYIMSTRSNLENKSFEAVISKEFEEIDEMRYKFRECFNNADCNVEHCYPRTILHRHDLNSSAYIMNSEKEMKNYFFTSYLFRSIYDDQIERWYSIFPKNQIYFLTSEELYANETKTMEDVAEWLGLPYFDFSSSSQMSKSWGGGASNRYSEPHSYEPMKPETREFLRKFFEPYNQRLYKLIGRDLGWM